MSLRRQLFFAMMVLITAVLSVNLVNSIYSARDFFQSQMQVHVQDASTSLGLQISSSGDGADLALMETTFNLLSDSGFYQRISYYDVFGKLQLERSRPLASNVPAWFTDLVSIDAVSGKAEVMSGWQQLGKVEIVAHPAYAYVSIWQVLLNQLWLFGVAMCLCYLFSAVALRYLLAPLTKVEQQAEAICRREFPVQETLPRTPELRRMVQAMNKMVQKIQAMFQEQVALSEGLHRKSYLDVVTELSNRRDFDARFDAFIRSELGGGSGALALIQLKNLQCLNDSVGREAGDKCLQDVASVLKTQFNSMEGALLSRRGGTDFCIFIPTVTAAEVREVMASLYLALASLPWFSEHKDVVLHLGVAHANSVAIGNKLLSQADMALRKAQVAGDGGWESYSEDSEQGRPAGEWRTLLQKIISDKAISFHYQPIYSSGLDGSRRTLMIEVLCRINDQGALVNAAEFWPMVERFDLSAQVDRLVLEQLQAQVMVWRTEGLAVMPTLCVNLSARSILNAEFCSWLYALLQRDTELAAHLVFELPEKAISISEACVRTLALRLRELGATLSLDHFGVAAQAFSYLQSLPLSHLKIDRNFIHNINDDADNQFFVRSLVQIAHSCDVMILAEGIETEAEWQQLQALGLDGGQGYYLARPNKELPSNV